MATNRSIVDMVEAIRGQSGRTGSDGMYIAKVQSVSPLSIRLHNCTISQGLYINPALMQTVSDAFTDSEIPPAMRKFLASFHEKYALKVGDEVVAYVSGGKFYVVGKAVKA